MSQPTLYVAITNHGFGHATRAASVAATVKSLWSDVRLILTTTAPRWLLQSYLDHEFTLRRRAFDIGVIQPDSLQMDRPATLARLRDIQANQAAIVEAEAAFLKAAGVSLVLADIPPLATAIAHAADIPCWMMSNFGWDFIYRAWGGEFTEIADWIADCFADCDRLFRLPFHEPMAAFPDVKDVGLTGGTARYDPAQLRQQWGIQTPQERTVLLTFGGLGLQQIPYQGLQQFPDWQFLTFDPQAPDLPNLVKVPQDGFRPVDIMSLCGRMVSKPGYSTFAEACRYDLPITTLTRDDFAEGPVLVESLRHYAYHQVVTPTDFFQGNWSFLQQPMASPADRQPLNKHGNQQIAEAIIAYLSQTS